MVSAPTSSPVQLPSPVKTRAPTPADSRQGRTTSSVWRRASPTTSRNRIAATRGLPKITEIAAAEPAAAITALEVASEAALVRETARRASPLPSTISGASGPTTAPSTRLTARGQDSAGNDAGWGRARAQSLRGHVPSMPRQVGHHCRDEYAGQPEREDRPPDRQVVEAETLGQRLPHDVFELAHRHQEAEGDQRDGYPDARSEQQQREVATAVQQDAHLGRRNLGRFGTRPVGVHPARLLESAARGGHPWQ